MPATGGVDGKAGKSQLIELVGERRGGLSEMGIALDDQRSSQIITVASISGLNRRITSGLAYGASKAGAIHLGKMLAHLLAPWGIRSNVINPGGKFTSTPIFSTNAM